jgi:hypothetical protein
VKVDGVSYPGGNSQSWSDGAAQGFLRLTTTDLAAHHYRQGFSFGSQIFGANDATSYLWDYASEKQALPFSQVFLRPRVTSASYPAIADAGTAATTVRALLSNKTSTATPWGVTGLAPGGANGEVTEVEDFAFIGRTMYVGGKFQYVQKGATPGAGEKVLQSYLAAFNVDTGEWIPSFRPTLDATVWALTATTDGKLIVGGEFTNVNGAAGTSSLAALDPTTGAVLAGWHAPISYVGTSTPNVRSLDVQDQWIYVGGRFNRIAGGATPGTPITLRGLARVSVIDGKPDANWKPNVDGTVFEVDASSRGDRVYLVGNFNHVNFTSSPMSGVVTTAAGAALVPGLAPSVSATGAGTKTYQQTVLEVGDDVWQGGSQHILSRYGRDAYNIKSGNITRNGGDFQALGYADGVVYGACHCVNYNYSNTTSYAKPIPNASDVNNIRFIGAWDATTGDYLPQFFVSSLRANNDMGPWAFKLGPDGCMWFGGDFTGGSYQGTSQQWLGGFGKLCPRDTTAPTPPANLAAKVSGTTATLTWAGSTDASSIRYEVLRGDRVVATVTGRSWTDSSVTGPAKYWVRAIDAGGNRSASTAALMAG